MRPGALGGAGGDSGASGAAADGGGGGGGDSGASGAAADGGGGAALAGDSLGIWRPELQKYVKSPCFSYFPYYYYIIENASEIEDNKLALKVTVTNKAKPPTW